MRIKNSFLWDSFYLFGDHKRIFINTNIGCISSCSYCYLPQLGFEIGKKPTNTIPYKKIISSLNSNFIKGKNGTIISFGCFSECWHRNARHKTKELIKFFVSQGNPVQFSTKQYVNWKDIFDIKNLIQWKGQLTIFISCPTITYWQMFEIGTVDPIERFKGFESVNTLDIPAYLYIKPVIENITILDITKFCDIMKKYNINAIVGSDFSKNNFSHKKAPIAKGLLFYNYTKDEKAIRVALKKVGKVYIYSTDPINEWRVNYG
jgi:DNA repair photolyase